MGGSHTISTMTGGIERGNPTQVWDMDLKLDSDEYPTRVDFISGWAYNQSDNESATIYAALCNLSRTVVKELGHVFVYQGSNSYNPSVTSLSSDVSGGTALQGARLGLTKGPTEPKWHGSVGSNNGNPPTPLKFTITTNYVQYAAKIKNNILNGELKIENNTTINLQREEQATVTITPAAGYRLDTIEARGDDDDKEYGTLTQVSDTNYTYTMGTPAKAVTINATFVEKTYNVVGTVSPSGIGYVFCTSPLAAGGEHVVQAILYSQHKDDYEFSGWTTNVPNCEITTQYSDSAASEVSDLITQGTFTMPASELEITAFYGGIPYDVAKEFRYGVNPVDAGTIISPPANKVQFDQQFTPECKLYHGWNLDKFIIDGQDFSAEYYTMPAHSIQLTASVFPSGYDCKVNTNIPNAGNPRIVNHTELNGVYYLYFNENITLVPNAYSEYKFVNWTISVDDDYIQALDNYYTQYEQESLYYTVDSPVWNVLKANSTTTQNLKNLNNARYLFTETANYNTTGEATLIYPPAITVITANYVPHDLEWDGEDLSVSQTEYHLTFTKQGTATSNLGRTVTYWIYKDGTPLVQFGANSNTVDYLLSDSEIEHTYEYSLVAVYVSETDANIKIEKVGKSLSVTTNPVHKTIGYFINGVWEECIPYYYTGQEWVEVEPYCFDGLTWNLCSFDPVSSA